MARVIVTGSTSTSLSLMIIELQEAVSQYTNFRFRLRVDGDYVYSSTPSVTVYNLTPDTTYTIQAQAEIGGTFYSVTSTYGITRPLDFSWDNVKFQGGNINLTALEWTNFTYTINRFRYWKGLGNYSFTPVIIGTEISATIVNESVYAISAMTSNVPFTVNSGDLIRASFFNDIVSSLNGIN